MGKFDGLTEVEIYKLLLDGTISRFPRYFWACAEESNFYAPKITRYLIEEVLKWDNEEIKKNLRKSTFEKYKLNGMLYIKYSHSPYKAITAAYPEREFKPWDFVNTTNSYWQGEEGKENAKEAIKWLLEDELNWSIDDIKKNVNHQVFIDNNLLGMLKRVFNSDLFDAIDYAYPNIFKRWEIGGHVKNEFWTREEGIKATKWLIEERLKWDREDIKKYYCKQIFEDDDLYGMIQRCFNSSPFEALDATYPDEFREYQLSKVPSNYWDKENATKAMKWLIDEDLKIIKGEDIRQHISKRLLIEKGLVRVVDLYGVEGAINLYKEANNK